MDAGASAAVAVRLVSNLHQCEAFCPYSDSRIRNMKKASVLCFALDVNIKKKKKQESGHRLVKVDLSVSDVKGIVSLMLIKHCAVQQGKHKRDRNEFVF